MLPSVVVSQIKACAERGDRVGEISVAFLISRQSVAKIITGRGHPKVRAARSVPTLVKLQADREAAERQAERDAEHDRKRLKDLYEMRGQGYSAGFLARDDEHRGAVPVLPDGNDVGRPIGLHRRQPGDDRTRKQLVHLLRR